jgi:hypothetical protein
VNLDIADKFMNVFVIRGLPSAVILGIMTLQGLTQPHKKPTADSF